MKTPCQADPELWVSESVKDRREAAQECAKCPAFAWCLDEIDRVQPTHGIWAGKDYSKTDALRPTHVTAMTKPCAASKCRSDRPWRWSQTHEQCVSCGRVDARHAAKGVCLRCYSRERRAVS